MVHVCVMSHCTCLIHGGISLIKRIQVHFCLFMFYQVAIYLVLSSAKQSIVCSKHTMKFVVLLLYQNVFDLNMIVMLILIVKKLIAFSF